MSIVRTMLKCDSFQVRLTSIMEILAKAAVVQIEKLLEENCAVLRLEMYRCQIENEKLRRKIRLMECDLVTAPGSGEAAGANELYSDNGRSPPSERVFGQECSFSPRRDGEPADLEESANVDQFRTEPVLIKQERLEEDSCYSDPQPTSVEEEQVTQSTSVEDGKKPDTEPTPVGDPEELSEKHRCGHGDEELSGLEFVGKAEQEGEHGFQHWEEGQDSKED
ncbi:hypothetical protein COCON_G00137180 [Conger conger]|uniref:Uncharacterized protein n=1 Tax=Conger conger TaxID=82655 RepID=A0A9Q1DF42_CONCO|nr:hypothetical protein COCON_G00137180 [Conger conger]